MKDDQQRLSSETGSLYGSVNGDQKQSGKLETVKEAVNEEHEDGSNEGKVSAPDAKIVRASRYEIEAAAEAKKERKKAIQTYALVTLVYITFTVTDGSVRTITLFHANSLGFDVMKIALMFTLYEFCGVLTNLAGGYIGARVGLRKTLITGIVLQLFCISGLMGWRDDFSDTVALMFVVFLQALAGVAKDFVKVSGKSVAKITAKEGEENHLLKLAAYMTGLKNAFKGFGFFFGAFATEVFGYVPSLGILLGMLVTTLPFCITVLSDDLGKSKKRPPLSWSIFKKGYNVNVLSLARLFLFGSRDIWFEVPVPLLLINVIGWNFSYVGLFMGVYTIIYGFVQTASPQFILSPVGCRPPLSKHVSQWTIVLLIPAMAMPLTVTYLDVEDVDMLPAVLISGITCYAVIFAVNAAVHSYLILSYSNNDKVATTVGFYYMANAAGRLAGTLLGGILYFYFSFNWCLWGSVVFISASGLTALFLKPKVAKKTVKKVIQNETKKPKLAVQPSVQIIMRQDSLKAIK